MFSSDRPGGARISNLAVVACAVPGSLMTFLGWLIAAYTDRYRLSAWIVLFGFAVLAINYLRIPLRRPRDCVGATSVMFSILMLEGYLLAFAGIEAGAFNDNAPYVIISALYLPVPLLLLVCGLFQWRHDAIFFLGTALLTLLGALGVLINSVLIQLALDAPTLFVDAFRTSSQTFYYDVVLFGEMVIASLALIVTVLKVCWVGSVFSKLRMAR